MFFGDRIKSIRDGDRVLDIGPGASPHPRASVYLERNFSDDNTAFRQRGKAPNLAEASKTVFYDGGRFPFQDKEFDYVVCSHVMEHVEDVSQFAAEICRVGKRGYLEFPTIYYDYIYDFNEHTMFVLFDNGEIRWMPKSESNLRDWRPITEFFYKTLSLSYFGLVDQLRPLIFQGFEWFDNIPTRRVHTIGELTYRVDSLDIPRMKPVKSPLSTRIASKLKRAIRPGK